METDETNDRIKDGQFVKGHKGHKPKVPRTRAHPK